jgi:Fe-S-cluster containining protein
MSSTPDARTEETLAVDHPKWSRVELAVFTRRVVADCMTHTCAIRATHTVKLDACCQYGCDVDLFERDEILKRADLIRPILKAEVQNVPWFDESHPEQDPDVPSGTVVRTAVHNDGCLFLSHDNRGCGIHRASLEQGWDFRGVKPTICRLFPLTYGEGLIGVCEDYHDYSCAYDDSAPTLYQVARDALGDIFGSELVVALDAIEARLAAAQPKKLPVVSST